jgi:formylglycine-generating enzyme required for sulfatase activity
MKLNFSFIILFITRSLCAQIADSSFHAYDQPIPGSEFKYRMVPIPAGSFLMGSPNGEKNREKNEGPQQRITLSAFWMGAYEVSYLEYNTFFQDETFSQNNDQDAITRPSAPYIDFTLSMGKEAGFPANSMQQYGAMMFCRWLYAKTGIFYRLPTEAEWEYACRAGSTTAYYFGEDNASINEYAWNKSNSNGTYHKSGLLKPNAWGLYDMLGNVAEWTLDQYDDNYFQQIADNRTDPVIMPVTRHPNTVKGGSYKDDAENMRCAYRIPTDPVWNRRDPQIPKSKWWNADAPFLGFRIIRVLKQPAKEEVETYFKNYFKK